MVDFLNHNKLSSCWSVEHEHMFNYASYPLTDQHRDGPAGHKNYTHSGLRVSERKIIMLENSYLKFQFVWQGRYLGSLVSKNEQRFQ